MSARKNPSKKNQRNNNAKKAAARVKERTAQTETKPSKDAFPIVGIGASVGEAQNLAELAVLAAIVQSSEDAIIRKGLNGIITHWNPAAEKIYGYSAAETLGRHIKLIIPPERMEENEELVRRVLRGEQIKAWETKRCTKDGRKIDIALSLSAIRDDRGKIIAVATIERDITERVMTRRRLSRIREELQMATRAARIGTWFLDFSRGTAQWNDEQYRLLGLDPRPGPEDIEFLFSFIHPDGRHQFRHYRSQTGP